LEPGIKLKQYGGIYLLRKKCYIIAGPNGAGKTTFANEFLPVEAECFNFINADLIAQGLSHLYLMNRNDKMKKHNKYELLALKAMERAATKVAEDARRNRYKIPIWKNGRIEYEIPMDITEQNAQAVRQRHSDL
jgi:hypothetical protein